MKRFTQTLYLLFISLLFLVGLSFSALAGEESAEKGTDCSSLETHSLENTYDGATWAKGSLKYTGQIYYIIYQAEHSYSRKYTGNHYHSGKFHYYEKAYVCDNCGSQYGTYYERVSCSGPPCILPFAIDDEVDK